MCFDHARGVGTILGMTLVVLRCLTLSEDGLTLERLREAAKKAKVQG